MDIKGLVLKLSAVSALGLFSIPSNAALVSAELDYGNDCNGYFGTADINGFKGCNVQFEGTQLSPVIAKYDIDAYGNVETPEVNDLLYPSIDGSEFSITLDTDASGSWSYTGTAPDPNVKYWTAKSGNGFTLFWNVSDADAAGVCAGDAWNLACLQAAQHTSGGDWYTADGKALSHITFYNSGVVPVPAAVWLFGSGLLGLVGVARRKRK